ncbi:hypothetical protein GCM10020369_28720 [Cryptosporangium minutisporangium]|uniref:NACHT domain-containing protein n=2 Tax=Cryptosporangium minutisporangium TaxID=113569 RepID=A0ABP6SWI5_9ACTN
MTEIAIGISAEIGAQVLMPVFRKLAKQIVVATAGNSGKANKSDKRAAAFLSGDSLAESLAIKKVQLPSDISNEQFTLFLTSPIAQALLQELVAVRLSDGSAPRIIQLKERWTVEATGRLESGNPSHLKKAAQQTFDILDDQCIWVVEQLGKDEPEHLARLHNDSLFKRITCVLESIENHMACLNATRPSDMERDEAFVREYRKQVIHGHSMITPPDFDRRRELPIEDIYVSPLITLADGETEGVLDTYRLLDYIDRTVLLGDPGAGKSTASSVLMYHCAKKDEAQVPFIVTLREFAASGRVDNSIVNFIEQKLDAFYSCKPPAGTLERLLVSGRCLVIFDGLDELLDTTRRREVTDVVRLFCNRYPLSSVLVTSRRVGYEQAPMDKTQFERLEISGFDRDRVYQYATKWFAQDDKLTHPEALQWAQSFVDESDEVADIRSTPLLLALMCIIYRGERSLPQNRPAVYERCATMLFDQWDNHRKIKVELRIGNQVDPILKHLAYWLLTTDDAGEGVIEDVLTRETQAYLHDNLFEDSWEAKLAAEEFVRFCRGRAWVFSDVGSTAEGEDLYKFTHRTFMEYFAAYELDRMHDSPERLARTLAPRVANAEWDVVAQLAVQICDKHNRRGADRIYKSLLGEKRRRAATKRENIYDFLARSLDFCSISPHTLRLLTRNVIASTLSTKTIPQSLTSLLMSVPATNRDLVAEEIATIVAETLANTTDPEARLHTILFACYYNSASYRTARSIRGFTERQEYWRKKVADLSYMYRAVILASIPDNPASVYLALREHLLSAADLVENAEANLAVLFRAAPVPNLNITYVSPAADTVFVAYGRPGFRTDRVLRAWTGIGECVRRLGPPPWVLRTSNIRPEPEGYVFRDIKHLIDEENRVDEEDVDIVPSDVYGLAVIACCLAELDPKTERSHAGLMRILRAFGTLACSAGFDRDAEPNIHGVPDPDGYLALWLEGTANFVRI